MVRQSPAVRSARPCVPHFASPGIACIVAGGSPGEPATYVGTCHVFCDAIEALQAGFGPHAQEIPGDIPNVSGLVPVIQISEVMMG